MGISERKEREKEARRTAILNAAEIVFRAKGFAVATMDDVARQAELAKGTVYLYYKSKEELQVGLVVRGMDLLAETFAIAMASKPTAIEKILTMGTAYWQFAEEHLYYFALMHIVDLPHREGLVSTETVQMLHERSNGIWSAIVSIMEEAKTEGTVKPEVNSLAVAMMLWMNCTAVLRFHHKIRGTPDNLWADRADKYNVCSMDWQSIYALNANLLLHEVVTQYGLTFLNPIEWPAVLKSPDQACISSAPDLKSFRFEPFAEEELPYAYHETGL